MKKIIATALSLFFIGSCHYRDPIGDEFDMKIKNKADKKCCKVVTSDDSNLVK